MAVVQTRIFFATDLHGSDTCFRKFLNAGKHHDADVLVIGGDVAGKRLVPLVRRSNGGAAPPNPKGRMHRVMTWAASSLGMGPPAHWTHRAFFEGRVHYLEGDAELKAFEQHLADQGAYALRCDADKEQELGARPAAVENEILLLIMERLARWVELADKRLHGQGRRLFVNAGNDDPFEIDRILDQSNVIVRPEGRVVELDGRTTMISCGFANETPWLCPRDITEEELRARIEQMADGLSDPGRCVFNLHCPPFNTLLDRAPKLIPPKGLYYTPAGLVTRGAPETQAAAVRTASTPPLRPVLTGLGVELAPAGSLAVRAAIEKYQPCVGLHGHIHESRGIDRLGRTICINPGSEYQDGTLHGAILDLEDGVVRSEFLTSG